VVVKDDVENALIPLEALEHPVPDRRVLAHLCHFAWAQLPLLEQDRVANANLANVMNETTPPDRLDVTVVQS
jgi:hypothetical protein